MKRPGSSVAEEALTASGEIEAEALRSETAQGFWGRYFQFYDTLNASLPYRDMIQRLVELLAPGPGQRVLDAGTGTGNVAVALKPSGASITGIDFCEAALEICRRKLPEARFEFGDLTRPLSFSDSEFDKIACCCVLHVLDRQAQAEAIREFARILKPGGRLAVTAFQVGFRPMAVYWETLRRQRRRGSLAATLRFAVRYSWNTLRIMLYVSKIKRMESRGEHEFLTRDGLAGMMEDAGLRVVLQELTFAGQCVTALGCKPGKAA